MAPRRKAGDEPERFWEHRNEIRSLARKVVRNSTTAEDIAQETLLRAFRHSASIDDARKGAWLTTVARRLAIDELRVQQRVESQAGLADRIDTTGDPEALAEHRALLEQVIEAIGRLTPRQQRLLLGRAGYGLSLAQLAAEERTTPASVRSVLARARAAIRTSLRDAGWTFAAASNPVLAKVESAIERLAVRLESLSSRLPSNGSDGLAAAVTAVSLWFAPAVPAASAPRIDLHSTASPTNSLPPAGVLGDLSLPQPAELVDRVSSVAGAVKNGDSPVIPFFETDGEVGHFAVSPDERTVLAQGGYVETAASKAAMSVLKEWEPILYRSDDGARTWYRVDTVGFVPGRVLFAPKWPADPRIFVVTGKSVTWTDDGRTFRKMEAATSGDVKTALGNAEDSAKDDPYQTLRREQRPPAMPLRPAVLSPRFSNGDERIFLGNPAEVFEVGLGTTEPIVSVPPWIRSRGIAPAPDYSVSSAVLVGAVVRIDATQERAALFRCAQRQCHEVQRFENASEPFGLFSSTTDPNLLYAWTTYIAYRSADGGTTWTPQLIGPVVELIEVRHRLVFLSLSGIPISDDRGMTWKNLDLLYSITAVAPVGRQGLLIAAGRRLACSPDRGDHWQPTCA